VERRRRFADPLAVPARHLLADILDHPRLAWDHLDTILKTSPKLFADDRSVERRRMRDPPDRAQSKECVLFAGSDEGGANWAVLSPPQQAASRIAPGWRSAAYSRF